MIIKKIFTFSFIVFGLGFSLALAQSPAVVLADHEAGHAPPSQSSSIVCQQIDLAQKNTDCVNQKNTIFGPGGVVNRGIDVLTYVAGAVAVLVIIIAGLMYVFSSGDPQNTARAKDALLYAVIGLVLTLVARTIVVFVIGRL